LLDVTMPGMGGPEILAALRQIPAAARVPVVFFTATSSEAETARLRALGAVGVIAKPFEITELPRQICDMLSGLQLH
jgi:CheY-like chemotaxis protein